MCKAYIECMNTGRLPNIESAWNYMCRSEARKAAAKAIEDVTAALDAEIKTASEKPLDAKRMEGFKLQVRMREGGARDNCLS